MYDPFQGIRTTKNSPMTTYETNRNFSLRKEKKNTLNIKAMNFSDIIDNHNGSYTIGDDTSETQHISKTAIKGESKRELKQKYDANDMINIDIEGDDDQYKYRPKTLYEEMSHRVENIIRNSSRKNLSIASIAKNNLRGKFNDSEIELSANRDLSNTRA